MSLKSGLSSFFFHFYIFLSISAFWWCSLYTRIIFLVFQSIFLVSSNLQLIISKLYLNTGTVNAPIAVVIFLALNSDFIIVLNPLVCFFHSFFHLLMLYTFTFISSYVLVSCPFSSSGISLLISNFKFCEWTDFPILSMVFVYFSSPNSIWVLSLNVLTIWICFWSSSSVYPLAWNCSCKVWLLCLCCVFISCVQHVELLCEGDWANTK